MATVHRFFDVPQPVSPSEIQVFQQFLALTVPNARRLQSMDALKDFIKQGFGYQHFCHGTCYKAAWQQLTATFARRGTEIPDGNPAAFTEEFYTNADKQIQWKAFLRTSKLEDITLELSHVTNEIQAFLSPPMIAVASNKSFDKKWPSDGPWK